MPVSAPRGARKPPSTGAGAALSDTAQESRPGMRGPSWWLTASPVPPQSSYPIWEDFNSKATKLHFPAEVRGAPAGEGMGREATPPTDRPPPISPGPPCWLLWPSGQPSRKWPTWPPTPSGEGTRPSLDFASEQLSGCEPKRTWAQSQDLGERAHGGELSGERSLSSLSRTGDRGQGCSAGGEAVCLAAR